ncbi:Unspecific monooxygenase [Aphelenchoides besseyi]|nr:Unspecific monooxygenase [Aphelenchoides besseyi]
MLLLLLFISLVLFLVYQFYWRRRNLPNGPIPLPVIGNAHSFVNTERWEDQFLKWREEFGPIYTYWLGPMAIVSVNDYELMQRMFVHDGDTYADRAPTEAFDNLIRGGVYGVVETSGNLWSQQRRFCLKVLRDLGLGKNLMQERILDEFEVIRENIDAEIKSGAKEIDFHRHTDIATGSVINAVVCGFRFTEKDHQKHFYMLKELADQIMKDFSKPSRGATKRRNEKATDRSPSDRPRECSKPLLNIIVSSPVLAKLPVFRQIMEKTGKLSQPIFEFLNRMIDEHLQLNNYADDNFEPRDFIDAVVTIATLLRRGFPKFSNSNLGL